MSTVLTVLDIARLVVAFLLLAGGVLSLLLLGVGLLGLPDTATRLDAVSKAGLWGGMALLLGAALADGSLALIGRAGLVLLVLVLGVPLLTERLRRVLAGPRKPPY